MFNFYWMSHLFLCISLLYENRKVLPSSLYDSVIAKSRFVQKYYAKHRSL